VQAPKKPKINRNADYSSEEEEEEEAVEVEEEMSLEQKAAMRLSKSVDSLMGREKRNLNLTMAAKVKGTGVLTKWSNGFKKWKVDWKTRNMSEEQKAALSKKLAEKAKKGAGAGGDPNDPEDEVHEYEVEKLIGSVIDGDLETVNACLLHGTSPRVRDKDGRTPLHHAVAGKRKACVKVLMAHQLGQKGKGYSQNGFNVPCKRENKRWTPVHEAAAQGHAEMLQMANSYKAKMEPRDATGMTPLMHAIVGNYEHCVSVLIGACKASMTAVDKQGRTPLHYAAMYGTASMVEMFLRLGCDVKHACCNGKTPADYARELHRSNVADILSKNRMDIVPEDLVNYIAKAEHVY
jgi:hypothetical protein